MTLRVVAVAAALLAAACLPPSPTATAPDHGGASIPAAPPAIATTPPSAPPADDTAPVRATSAERTVREATFAVVVRAHTGGTRRGSGVHVGGGVVLTAAHVVADAAHVRVRAWDDPQPQAAYVVAVDRSVDAAALRLDPAPDHAVPLAETPPHPGDALLVAGYPGSAAQTLRRGPLLGDVVAADVAAQLAADGLDAPLRRVGVATSPGASGGAVATDHGELAGLLLAVEPSASHAHYVPAAQLRHLAAPRRCRVGARHHGGRRRHAREA